MKRNTKKRSLALLVASAVVTVLAVNISALYAQAPQSGQLGQTARNGNSRHFAKPGKRNPQFSSSYDSGANEASILLFSEATDW
jgi:hypothetical protein